ncbi:Man1-Src1p-C-terminal domain-containing protein [Mycena belliarum]|uniref:Man1-Src1p-C-terminal domain-containing protein n=1 Tax=Mycena belliarum TaxID=1033014 RepID=A0AAD6UBC1_9AGAR|nr:Man1-Src1p-C-terminal domain-containing protein [Mycena belliae]
MSRLTSAQIISQGDYLDRDFDPASLTVSQLLGVLGYHNIVYPSPYSKPKLIAQFNAEIKPRAAKFKKERLKAEASIASEEGITDGHTGEPLGGADKPPVVRRSSRRLSRAPSQEQEVSPVRLDPVRLDPPKRRRSSAQPNLGGPSRKLEHVEPVVVEESEPEEEELPVRKIGRSKKTARAAGEQGRRVSHAEESGWEDNNVFQSGAESSSPARPRPKSVRKSVGPRKTRKSVSAPPEMLPSSPLNSPPQSKFEPQLPPSVAREARIVAPQFKTTTFVPQEHQQPKEEQQDSDIGDTDFADDGPTEDFGDGGEYPVVDEEYEEEDQNTVISRRIAEGGSQIAIRPASPEKLGAMSILFRVVFLLASLASSGVVLNYKLESATIGYCDAGRPTNAALEGIRAHRLAVEACNRANSTIMADGAPCPLPALPVPHPDACTPCPEHSTCTQFTVACDTGYLLHPHPLLFFLPAESTPDALWRAIGNATDGLPWLGSVGLPPRCVEDPRRKRHIGALGKAVENELGQMRGRRVCAGSRGPGPFPDAEGGEARRWGDTVETVADRMRKKTSDKILPKFDELYTAAIQELSEWGGIIIGEDARSGKRYIALKTPHLSWDCVVLVRTRAVWEEWRATVYGLVALILGGAVTRARRAQSAVEGQRVAGLVQTALDTLRAQERAYHADPETSGQPYLSSLQLRDVVLADEHSVPARARLWARVERVVEGNANVRANLEEVDGGDEMRVWRWVGGPSPSKRIE